MELMHEIAGPQVPQLLQGGGLLKLARLACRDAKVGRATPGTCPPLASAPEAQTSRPPSISCSCPTSPRSMTKSLPPSCPPTRPASARSHEAEMPGPIATTLRLSMHRSPSFSSVCMPSPVPSICDGAGHLEPGEAAVGRPASPPLDAAVTWSARPHTFVRAEQKEKRHRKKKRKGRVGAAHANADSSNDDSLDLAAAWVQNAKKPRSPERFACQFCGRTFPAATAGKHPQWHLYSHENVCPRNPDRGYECDRCGNLYPTEDSLAGHICPRRR